MLTFDLESGVRVTFDVGYLCANFGLPRPLSSRVRLDVRDRQTDRRHTSDRRQTTASLNASALWGWRHNKRLARNSAATVYKLLQISK